MSPEKKEHELMRRKIWMDAWCSTATANDCKTKSTVTAYADAALAAFDQKFSAFEPVRVPAAFSVNTDIQYAMAMNHISKTPPDDGTGWNVISMRNSFYAGVAFATQELKNHNFREGR